MNNVNYILLIETYNDNEYLYINENLRKKDFDIIQPNVFMSNANMVDTIIVGKDLKEKYKKFIKNIKFIRVSDISNI